MGTGCWLMLRVLHVVVCRLVACWLVSLWSLSLVVGLLVGLLVGCANVDGGLSFVSHFLKQDLIFNYRSLLYMLYCSTICLWG